MVKMKCGEEGELGLYDSEKNNGKSKAWVSEAWSAYTLRKPKLHLESTSQVVCSKLKLSQLIRAAGTQQIGSQIFEQCWTIFQTITAVIVKAVQAFFFLEKKVSVSFKG